MVVVRPLTGYVILQHHGACCKQSLQVLNPSFFKLSIQYTIPFNTAYITQETVILFYFGTHQGGRVHLNLQGGQGKG